MDGLHGLVQRNKSKYVNQVIGNRREIVVYFLGIGMSSFVSSVDRGLFLRAREVQVYFEWVLLLKRLRIDLTRHLVSWSFDWLRTDQVELDSWRSFAFFHSNTDSLLINLKIIFNPKKLKYVSGTI